MKIIAQINDRYFPPGTQVRRDALAWLLRNGITSYFPQQAWLMYNNPFFYYEAPYGALRWDPSVLFAVREHGNNTIHWRHVLSPNPKHGRGRGRYRIRYGLEWHYLETMDDAKRRQVIGAVARFLRDNNIVFQAELQGLPAGRRVQDNETLFACVETILDVAAEEGFGVRFRANANEKGVIETWRNHAPSWLIPPSLYKLVRPLDCVWLDCTQSDPDSLFEKFLDEYIGDEIDGIVISFTDKHAVVIGNRFLPTAAGVKLIERLSRNEIGFEERLRLLEARVSELESVIAALSLKPGKQSRGRYGTPEITLEL